MWWTYALLSAVFAALTAILAKVGMKGVDSSLATAVRTVMVLGLAWGIVYAQGGLPGLAHLTRQNWLFLTLSGLATGLSWVCYFRALQLGPVSKVAPVDKLSVALAIGLSVLFLGEKLTWQTGLGAGLILAGTLVLIR
ncbi:EamA family transporter [Hymenobacter sp. UYP22]|uniref:EamA family transporter n=1 Tax=Hymenobacter sp. UYP22 TaxID=3156348 RepID=UPI0033942DF0